MEYALLTHAPEETKRLGGRLAAICRVGDCIALSGDLGAGKTVFAAGFIESLVMTPVRVTSPTFALLQTYDVQPKGGRPITLWHYDLYRVEHEDELEELGIGEATRGNHIVLVEWPQRAPALLPEDRLDVRFELTGAEERRITLSGNPSWQSRLAYYDVNTTSK